MEDIDKSSLHIQNIDDDSDKLSIEGNMKRDIRLKASKTLGSSALGRPVKLILDTPSCTKLGDTRRETNDELHRGSLEIESSKPSVSSTSTIRSKRNTEALIAKANKDERIQEELLLKRLIQQQLNEKKKVETSEASTIVLKENKLSIDDFQMISTLGRGAYAEVLLVKKKTNEKQYALKVIDKKFLKKEQKQYQVYIEREVLAKLDSPYIIKLYSSFQDKNKLYFVLEYCNRGEFGDYIRIKKNFTKPEIVFYTAEMVNILEYLHNNGIAHRDFKPENLILTEKGHLKCIDFGTAKFLDVKVKPSQMFAKKTEEVERNSEVNLDHRSTFVGTAQFVSPEMLEDGQCEAPADLWALGCIIYLMACGEHAFHDKTEFLIFKRIKALDVKYPEGMDIEMKSIIQALLKRNPYERLGAGPKGTFNDYIALKKHSFFKGIDFKNLINQDPPAFELYSPYRGIKLSIDKKFFFGEWQKKSTEKSKDFQVNLTGEIRVIISGLVLQQYGFLFSSPKYLVLTSIPTLSYYHPLTNVLEGKIPLTPKLITETDNKAKLIFKFLGGKHTFKVLDHPLQKWTQAIDLIMRQLQQ